MNLSNHDATEPAEVRENSAKIQDDLASGEVRRAVLALTQMGGPIEFKQSVTALVNLSVNAEKDTWRNYSEAKDVIGHRAAIRLCRWALVELSKGIEESAAETVEWYRRELDAIEPLPATPEEATAHIYWQAMEKLNASELSFDALLDYHRQSDGEVEA